MFRMTKIDFDRAVGGLVKKRGYTKVAKHYPVDIEEPFSKNFEKFLRKRRKINLPRLSFKVYV